MDCNDRRKCPQECEDCACIVYLDEECPEDGVIRCWSCQQKVIDFLLGQFQIHNPDMGGQHRYMFRNCGWPMTHLRGPNIEAAVSAAMFEVERSRLEALGEARDWIE